MYIPSGGKATREYASAIAEPLVLQWFFKVWPGIPDGRLWRWETPGLTVCFWVSQKCCFCFVLQWFLKDSSKPYAFPINHMLFGLPEMLFLLCFTMVFAHFQRAAQTRLEHTEFAVC